MYLHHTNNMQIIENEGRLMMIILHHLTPYMVKDAIIVAPKKCNEFRYLSKQQSFTMVF